MRKLNPDIFFTYWCHKIEPSSLPWILNTVRAKKKIEDSKYPDTCVWTGRFDLNPDTCGRGNFCILKEKVVDSKKNRIRVDGALIGTPLGVSKFDFSDNFCCLPFTWANRWVDGLGKWYVKFMTGKIRPRIAFTICTNQFHTPRNDSEGLKLVPKMADGTKDGWWYQRNETRISFWKILSGKKDYLFRSSIASGNFTPGTTQKVLCLSRFNRVFRKLLVNGKQARKLNSSDHRTLLSKPLIFFFPSSSSLLVYPTSLYIM